MSDRVRSAGCTIFENKDEHEKHRCTIEIVLDDLSSKMKKTHCSFRVLPLANIGIKEEDYEIGSGVNDAWWLFRVEFRGDGSEAKTEIGAYLSIENEEEFNNFEVKATYTLSMLNESGVEMARVGGENVEMSAPSTQDLQWLLTYAELLENPLFIEDSLRFRANIEFCIPAESAISKICTPSDLWQRSGPAMFNSPKCSDFKLQSNDGKIFHVHRVILSFRSDVFAAMFEHKLKEIETGECVVQDVDGETLEALLKFLYGLNEWKPHLVEKLIVAADKYQILDLVNGCGRELIRSLTVKNVARILQLANQISFEKLKEAALGFIVSDFAGFNDAGGFVELAGNVGLLQELKDFRNQTRKCKKQKTTG